MAKGEIRGKIIYFSNFLLEVNFIISKAKA